MNKEISNGWVLGMIDDLSNFAEHLAILVTSVAGFVAAIAALRRSTHARDQAREANGRAREAHDRIDRVLDPEPGTDN